MILLAKTGAINWLIMIEKEACNTNLTSDFVYGYGPSNLKLICESSTFSVHCDVFSQSSEVWEKMLNSAFAESLEETVTLHGDDPRALKLSLDIVYGLLFGKIDAASFEIDSQDRAKLDLFAEKYELKGVSTFLNSVALWRAQLSQLKSLQQQLQLSEQSGRTGDPIIEHNTVSRELYEYGWIRRVLQKSEFNLA